MKIKEARNQLNKFICRHLLSEQDSAKIAQVCDVVDDILEEAQKKQEADGCSGCAFYDKEEWEMPCVKCKRNCKDYWRAKG